MVESEVFTTLKRILAMPVSATSLSSLNRAGNSTLEFPETILSCSFSMITIIPGVQNPVTGVTAVTLHLEYFPSPGLEHPAQTMANHPIRMSFFISLISTLNVRYRKKGSPGFGGKQQETGVNMQKWRGKKKMETPYTLSAGNKLTDLKLPAAIPTGKAVPGRESSESPDSLHQELPVIPAYRGGTPFQGERLLPFIKSIEMVQVYYKASVNLHKRGRQLAAKLLQGGATGEFLFFKNQGDVILPIGPDHQQVAGMDPDQFIAHTRKNGGIFQRYLFWGRRVCISLQGNLHGGLQVDNIDGFPQITRRVCGNGFFDDVIL